MGSPRGDAMKIQRRRFLHLAAGAAAVPLASRIASAQAYPTRPITLIVPFPPGGSTDVAARIAADHMSRTLGQQIVVQNVSGAGGTTGSTRAMRSDPDGYTILMGQMGTHAAAVALYPNLAYKPAEDFETIGLVTGFPIIIAAKKDFPAKDLKEFVAHVKANSASLNQAHAGVGSIFFTTCLLLNSIIGAKPTPVPFNGGAPAMNALVGGQVDYMCADIITGGTHHEGGKIKVYGIAASAPQSGLAGRADHGGSRPARIPGVGLERLPRAQGHAEADHRQACRCARQGARRRRNTQAHAGAWLRHSRKSQARTRAVPRTDQERDRPLVADHQERQRQAGLGCSCAAEVAANANEESARISFATRKRCERCRRDYTVTLVASYA